MRRFLIALLVIFALAPVIVSAEEKGDTKRSFGLTFPSIGVIWHITNNIAFMPNISLSHNWSKLSSGSFDSDNTNNSVTVNAGLRFYIREWKGMRFYLTPRYSYGWSNTDSSNNAPFAISPSYTIRSHTHSVSGAWGIQYAITNWLSLFGDIGAEYTRGHSDASSEALYLAGGLSSIDRQKTNAVSTTGTWGLILYLK